MKSKDFIPEAKEPIQWGKLTIVNQNLIADKAKTQKDGIYRVRGIMYKVQNNRATYFAIPSGEIVMAAGNFNVSAGSFEGGMGWEDKAKKLLKSIK